MAEMKLGEKIYLARKGQRLTQESLGDRLGISGQAVSKWENDEAMPDISLVPKLCALLKMSADMLLGTAVGEVSNGSEDIVYVLRILADEKRLNIWNSISDENAVTAKEIATEMAEEDVKAVLGGFMKRCMVICSVDKEGKRGYLRGAAADGVQMILNGCHAVLAAEKRAQS